MMTSPLRSPPTAESRAARAAITVLCGLGFCIATGDAAAAPPRGTPSPAAAPSSAGAAPADVPPERVPPEPLPPEPPDRAAADDEADVAELPAPAAVMRREPERRQPPEEGEDPGTRKDRTKAEAKPGGARDDAADGRCDVCGGCRCVARVCVPRMTQKEVTKVCWDAKCEQFCVPGPSLWCGRVCKRDDCGCWTHDLWKPTCAEVRTRVVPVRKETKRKVAAVEWKVVERCARCRARPACGGGSEGGPEHAEAKPAGGGENAKAAGPAERLESDASPVRSAPAGEPRAGLTWLWPSWGDR